MFGENVIEHKICVLRNIQRNIITNVHRISCTVSVILVRF
jgi:hypothetical protein